MKEEGGEKGSVKEEGGEGGRRKCEGEVKVERRGSCAGARRDFQSIR